MNDVFSCKHLHLKHCTKASQLPDALVLTNHDQKEFQKGRPEELLQLMVSRMMVNVSM